MDVPRRARPIGLSKDGLECSTVSLLHTSLKLFNPFITSSPTPSGSRTIFTNLPTIDLFIPPLAGLHTPRSSSSSVVDAAAASRAGGSMVLSDSNRKAALSSPVLLMDREAPIVPTVTAQTASATASSSLAGSKKMLSPTDITRRVNGGREPVSEAYKGSAASQSSLKSGSSSILDIGAGSFVASSARWVVRLRRGRG